MYVKGKVSTMQASISEKTPASQRLWTAQYSNKNTFILQPEIRPAKNLHHGRRCNDAGKAANILPTHLSEDTFAHHAQTVSTDRFLLLNEKHI